MDCFGTYFTHAQSCDNVRVHSATEWTASVHTLRMPKAVITFMFKVLQEGLLRYIHMPKAVTTFVFKVLRSGLCFRRFRVFAVFAFSFFPVSVLGVFAFSRFRVPPAAPPRPGHRFRVHSIGGFIFTHTHTYIYIYIFFLNLDSFSCRMTCCMDAGRLLLRWYVWKCLDPFHPHS